MQLPNKQQTESMKCPKKRNGDSPPHKQAYSGSMKLHASKDLVDIVFPQELVTEFKIKTL